MLLSWAPSRQDCRKDFPTRPLRCPPLLGVVHGYGVLLVSHRNATQNRLISRNTPETYIQKQAQTVVVLKNAGSTTFDIWCSGADNNKRFDGVRYIYGHGPAHGKRKTRLEALGCAQERPEPLARGDRERHALPPAPSSAIALFAFVFVSRPRIVVVPNTLLPSTARFGRPCRSRCPAGKCRSIVIAAPWVRVFRPDGDATAIPRMVGGGQR